MPGDDTVTFELAGAVPRPVHAGLEKEMMGRMGPSRCVFQQHAMIRIP
jgi:hypothetical protein